MRFETNLKKSKVRNRSVKLKENREFLINMGMENPSKSNRMRVLIVDDDSMTRHSLCRLLAVECGYDVVQAADGKEAVDAMSAAEERDLPFDMVLADVLMPRVRYLFCERSVSLSHTHIHTHIH